MLLKSFHIPRTVQQEGTAVYQLLNHVVFVHIGRIVTCYEVCLLDQIGGFDRALTETKVRHGNTAGFLGVIIKVCLRIHVCVITNDLDGVLICAYRTVCAQSPELTVDGSFRCGNQRSANFQRQIGYIIHDTYGEFCFFCVVKYCYDLCRCRILGSQSITSGENRNRIELRSLQSCYHIQIQRLAKCSRLFCSV